MESVVHITSGYHRRPNVSSILAGLVDATKIAIKQKQPIYSADIKISVSILNKVLKFVNSGNIGQILGNEGTNNFLGVANNLLDASNIPVWKRLKKV